VVVWKTADEPEDSTAVRERERERRLDPEDVPAIEWRPRPKEALATLYPAGGAPYGEPRFLRDGERILLTRYTGRGDGAIRLDIFMWNFKTGQVRRVTHGAGIQHADPSPDGRYAVADRCVNGICDVVRVHLATGRMTRLAAGAPRLVYYRPRYSPDGREIVVSVQYQGRWQVALLDSGGGAPRIVGPDDGANRYHATFLPDGKSLVVISDASGIPNVELLDPATGATRALTQVTSAALAPEPRPGDASIYYLCLHGKGLDLDRVVPESVTARPAFATSPRLSPATRVPVVSADTFARERLPAPHPYGLGQRWHRVLPAVSLAAEGKSFGADSIRWDGSPGSSRAPMVIAGHGAGPRLAPRGAASARSLA
jgi:Tol biopolymer transport system component